VRNSVCSETTFTAKTGQIEMHTERKVTFVVAINNRDLLEANFLRSPCVRGRHVHEILVQQNFSSAAKAYNDAISKSRNDLIVFCHQDVIFPEAWLSRLENALDDLTVQDPAWGVLGCYGKTSDGDAWGQVYSSGLGVIGTPVKRPKAVQTLDELVLILRKSSGLRFDERLPHFHLYGTDICLAAAKTGMKSYAMSAFCIHNTQLNLVLPKEFYECCKCVKRMWREYLPIQTTCVRITRFNVPLYERRLRESHLRYVRSKEIGAFRVKDTQRLLERFDLF